MNSYSKEQLLDINNHINYGFNWIKNIENINDRAWRYDYKWSYIYCTTRKYNNNS